MSPGINVYLWLGKELPALNEIGNMQMLPTRGGFPQSYAQYSLEDDVYMLGPVSTSEKVIPKDNLTLLGNIPGSDLVPYQGRDTFISYRGMDWKKFEQWILNLYFEWNTPLGYEIIARDRQP